MRLLLQQYVSFEGCPARLSAPIVELTNYRQSDATRKRFKAVAHLPLATPFYMAELDISALLSAEMHAQFGDELRRRR